LLHKQALARGGVQHLQKQSMQRLLQRDKGAFLRGVHGLKVPRELPQGSVHHLPDRSQRMVFSYPSFSGQITAHGVLMDVVAPNGFCLPQALWVQILASIAEKRDLYWLVFNNRLGWLFPMHNKVWNLYGVKTCLKITTSG
jgi:hypothetical protein